MVQPDRQERQPGVAGSTAVAPGNCERFARAGRWICTQFQPGLGAILGARVLGEFGDDPDRYADAKSRKNYGGTSPITRASGKKKVVAARFIHNDRLIDALMTWAFASLNASPGARAFYDQQRARTRTKRRAPAARQPARRHPARMLKTRTLYDEATWAPGGALNSSSRLSTSADGDISPAGICPPERSCSSPRAPGPWVRSGQAAARAGRKDLAPIIARRQRQSPPQLGARRAVAALVSPGHSGPAARAPSCLTRAGHRPVV